MDEFSNQVTGQQYSDSVLTENVETLKAFMGDLGCSDQVLKLALSKCKLNLEETIMLVTNREAIADMEEEIRRE